MPIDVLLLQLGTPSEPTARGVRPYLREFLNDRRVLELPSVARWLLVNTIIAPFRAPKSAVKYHRIWDLRTGSPLLDITRKQTQALGNVLGPAYRVRFAMRYGEPSIPEVMKTLVADNCEKLLVLPMFPQYSATTTASGLDKLFECLMALRVLPSLRVIRDYHKDAGYVKSVAATIHDQLKTVSSKAQLPEYNLISFHGIPATYIARGDIYRKQCLVTADLLAAQMNWPSDKWQICFQSRLGRQEWLVPYTDVTLKELGKKGLKRVLIVQPGFTADCLETIDEIGNEGTEEFRSTGGETLLRVPCVNDHPSFISALADIVSRESRGWGL